MENNLQNTRDNKSKIKIIENFFKKYFFTGLFVILPLWLTFVVVMIIFNWTSSFTRPVLLPVFKFFLPDNAWFIYPLTEIVSFFLSLVIISLIGFFTTQLIGKKLLALFENEIICKLPLLGSIYTSLKKLVSFFSNKDKKLDFKSTVFVPFPAKDSYCLAFSTGERYIDDVKYISVFMPTTPNPTTGFLMLFKENDIKESDYTVEEAVQFIISAGIIVPENKTGVKTNPESTNV